MKSDTKAEVTPIGGYLLSDEPVEYNQGYDEISIKVRNTGDRPIQVGSHFHFFEANAFLEFDRKQAFGRRLNIPATTALRFEAGDEKIVSLVPFQGKQRVVGFNNLVDGWTGCEKEHSYRPRLNTSLENIQRFEFSTKEEK